MLSPIIEETGSEAKGFKVEKVNVDERTGLARKYNVMSIPAVIVFKNGKPGKASVGIKSKSSLL